jgi:hypothetical protein
MNSCLLTLCASAFLLIGCNPSDGPQKAITGATLIAQVIQAATQNGGAWLKSTA